MKKINIFCFGFGQVAKSLIRKLSSEKTEINLFTTSREENKKKKIDKLVYDNFKFDEKNYDKLLIKALEKSDYILVSIPPVAGHDLVLENFDKIIKKYKFKWITYLSATSVYGDHNGEWVNEESKTNPTSSNGVNRLSAEKLWMKLADNANLPLQIFRLSGIYSNQRNILERIKSGKAKIISKKNQFFSRIHVDDIGRVLFKSFNNFKPKEIYNISDDVPASSEELTSYGSKLLGVELPQKMQINEVKNEMLKNFYKDSKKVSNKKMKSFFNYKLKYPSFVEGLNYIRNNLI